MAETLLSSEHKYGVFGCGRNFDGRVDIVAEVVNGGDFPSRHARHETAKLRCRIRAEGNLAFQTEGLRKGRPGLECI